MTGQSATLNVGYVISVNKSTLTIYSANKWTWEDKVISDKKVTIQRVDSTIVVHAEQIPSNIRDAVAQKLLEGKNASKTP